MPKNGRKVYHDDYAHTFRNKSFEATKKTVHKIDKQSIKHIFDPRSTKVLYEETPMLYHFPDYNLTFYILM